AHATGLRSLIVQPVLFVGRSQHTFAERRPRRDRLVVEPQYLVTWAQARFVQERVFGDDGQVQVSQLDAGALEQRATRRIGRERHHTRLEHGHVGQAPERVGYPDWAQVGDRQRL